MTWWYQQLIELGIQHARQLKIILVILFVQNNVDILLQEPLAQKNLFLMPCKALPHICGEHVVIGPRLWYKVRVPHFIPAVQIVLRVCFAWTSLRLLTLFYKICTITCIY